MIKEIVKPIPSLVNMMESVTENVLTSYIAIDWSEVIALNSATIMCTIAMIQAGLCDEKS